MEKMVMMESLFGGAYKGKKVMITGHTGFKGSWLARWLSILGAKVSGYSLKLPGNPDHFSLLKMDMDQEEADVRDLEKLKRFIAGTKPDIVFHLAAQALVRESYLNPADTFTTNVTGTLNVLEACRNSKSVSAIVIITSDKCYENREWIWGYRENDPLGGYDPYSASKGCAEILTSSYRNSFYHPDEYGKSHHTLIASCRAGNVIGGGDWAADRLIPDIVRAASSAGKVIIRNPDAYRPWQHVLEPLSAYLLIGWRLMEGKKEIAGAWNFGPALESNISVREIAGLAQQSWADIRLEYGIDPEPQHEANLLMLDCSKAYKMLKWKPVWNIKESVSKTILWYKTFYTGNGINTDSDIYEYITSAQKSELIWSS